MGLPPSRKSAAQSPDANSTSHCQLITELLQEIEAASMTCSLSTTINRRTAVNALSRFFKERIPNSHLINNIKKLTPDHLKAFERWHLDQDLSLNYSACNMRNLRAVIVRISSPERGHALFATVRTANTQTLKRAVTPEVINKLQQMPLPEDSFEAKARDIFLICLKTMGMPLIDAAHLTKKQLADGHISYYRHKTHRQARPLVPPDVQQTISRLSPADSPYLLPILTSTDYSRSYKQYKNFLQRYNRTLGRLASRISPDCHLTSYTPRHTWASIAHSLGANLSCISQALTHASTATTLSYIQSIDNQQIDDVNRMVLELFNNENTLLNYVKGQTFFCKIVLITKKNNYLCSRYSYQR